MSGRSVTARCPAPRGRKSTTKRRWARRPHSQPAQILIRQSTLRTPIGDRSLPTTQRPDLPPLRIPGNVRGHSPIRRWLLPARYEILDHHDTPTEMVRERTGARVGVHPRDVGRMTASSVLYVEVQNRVALEAVLPEAVFARRLESYQRSGPSRWWCAQFDGCS